MTMTQPTAVTVTDHRATLDVTDAGFVTVCPVERIPADGGVAALVDGVAVAVFRLGDGTVHAIDNVDPFSGASVLSRGIVADVDGQPTVAAPHYKQRFRLTDGRCVEDDAVSVRAHEVHVRDGRVAVRLAR
jgi:nitrite reductase (NADH) small subunit